MTILIFGNENEEHSRYIFDKLSACSAKPVYFDSMQFPTHYGLSFEPGRLQGGFFSPEPGEPPIALSDVRSVYWRTFNGVNTEHIEDPFLKSMAYREIDSALGSFFRNLSGALWVNPAHAIELHKYKGHQLQMMRQMGIRIPETLFTNRPEDVVVFYERMNRQIIYKPVLGGAHTQMVKPEDLALDRLCELNQSPVQFQEMIPGVDIRAYLVGEEIFAAEIRSETLDFRDHPGAPIVPITLPEAIQDQCRAIGKAFSLVLSGIDIRRTPEGEHVFIEANPSPMFQYFEGVTRYPISDSLVALLIKG